MLIKQVFNNNVVLVDDDLKKREYILIGKGLGFQKKKGMKVDIDRVEKKFISDDASVKKRLIALAEEVDPDIFDATSEMIGRIEKELGQDLYKYIYLSLTDHIAFAIKRNKEGILVRNSFLHEIKRIYKNEFAAAMLALEYLNERFNVDLNEDEAGFIAIHIVNSYYQGNSDKYDEDIKVLKIMKDILNIIRYYYKIDYDEDDLDYDRLVTHVRFFAKRVLLMKRLVDNNDDLLELVKIKYDRVYRCVEKINDYIMNNYSYEIGNDEKLYLILHIDRVTRKY
nr:PRD domain-containing protein [uncultured Peptostreptococcus sp.]